MCIRDRICSVFKEVVGIDLPKSFPRLNWNEAMDKYGSDKPDLRFDMCLINLKPLTDRSDFNTFKSVESVKGLVVPGGAKYSRKNIDELTDFVKKYNAKGLAWMKAEGGLLTGGISKFFNKDLQKELIGLTSINEGDIIFLIGDEKELTQSALGALRVEIGKSEGLVDTGEFKPVWVTDLPMF